MSEAITPEGMEALKAELDELEGPARRRMAERLHAARDLGDLKENADYHIAKEDQAHLETRIKRLRDRLQAAVVTEASTDTEVVAFGATVHVIDEATDKPSAYTIVGPTEADLAAGKLSAESPVAEALMGCRIGDVAVVSTPTGERRLRVERLS